LRRVREQKAIACFFAASKRLVSNDSKGAAELFRKCLEFAEKGSAEYSAASAELKDLGKPK